MARSISEQEQQLKKRARRRLVGAIVLVTAVAVVLPMVLDSEPKPVRQNVDIHIPSPEAGEFKPKTSEAAPQPSAPIKGLPEAPAGVPPSDTAMADATSAASAQSAAPDITRSPLPPAKRDATAPQRPAAGDRTEPPRAASAAPKSKPETSARSDRTESAGASSASAAKSGASAARPSTESDRADTRDMAASAKRPADAESASGNYVVQVAALADAAKARQLQKQMSGAGLKTYTEVISTKAGEVTRVRAGPYATREAAEKARVQLKKAGLDGQVVAK
jgi:DedD protein